MTPASVALLRLVMRGLLEAGHANCEAWVSALDAVIETEELAAPDSRQGVVVLPSSEAPSKRTKGQPWRRLRRRVIERDGYVCQLCGYLVEPHDVHIDHIVPLCRGGRTVLEKLQVTHSRCNTLKGDKDWGQG